MAMEMWYMMLVIKIQKYANLIVNNENESDIISSGDPIGGIAKL
jgi:hypothetical protein